MENYILCILNYYGTHFITSSPKVNSLPQDIGKEVVFTGYSNVGKSSSLNVLTNQKKLAYQSKTPGSTKLINIFEINKNQRLIDLPGYGYSKINKKDKKQLQEQIYKYFQIRNSLKGLIILIDIRRLLRNIDQEIINIAYHRKIPILVLLSKADKLSYNKRLIQLNILYKTISSIFRYNEKYIKIEIFSSLRRLGLKVLKQSLDNWLT